MPVPILMPALSPTMTEGNLAKWHVKEGDAISAGDVVAEIETDKATMEVEAVEEGTVGRLVVSEGTEGVAVNAVIAYLLEEGEDASALPSGDGGAEASSSTPAPAPQPTPVQAAPVAAASPPASAAAADGGARTFASPLARRMAAQAGLDLGALSGSGPNGRIVKADIERVLAGGVQ